MPQKSAPELFAVVHYLHRLSTEGKRGAKMALESCPKCHFIMLEGVLMTIEEHGQNGTIYVSDLAAAVKQPLPAVSRALRQLEQDGLIERITDPNDRRKTLVRPTEKGLDASRQAEAAISRYFERVICRIPEEQREQLFSRTTHSRTPTQRCEDGRYLALERFISRKTHSHPKATLLLKRVSLTMYSLHPVSRCCQDVLSPFRHQTG